MENKIRILPFEDGLLIKFSGELDSCKTLLYKNRIQKEMYKSNPHFLLFDLKDCTFLDSAGIGLILGRFNEIDKVNGKCGFLNLSPYAKKVIRISGLFSIMKEYTSIGSFKKEMEVIL